MLTLKFEGAEVDSLVSILQKLESIIWSNVWSSTDRVVGVFVQSSPGAIGSIVMIVILNYEKETKGCDIEIMGFGGGERVWFNDLLDGNQSNLRHNLIDLAENKGWKWREVDEQIQTIRCPHCYARFQSDKGISEVVESSKCQHCHREFGPVRVVSEDWTPQGIRCPYCRTVNIYEEYQITRDREVHCQTCGRSMQLDVLKNERYLGFSANL
ncbi:MAG: hypothetical protein ACFFE2_15795 [Candidatus Thorarchaeota archaeon]